MEGHSVRLILERRWEGMSKAKASEDESKGTAGSSSLAWSCKETRDVTRGFLSVERNQPWQDPKRRARRKEVFVCFLSFQCFEKLVVEEAELNVVFVLAIVDSLMGEEDGEEKEEPAGTFSLERGKSRSWANIFVFAAPSFIYLYDSVVALFFRL